MKKQILLLTLLATVFGYSYLQAQSYAKVPYFCDFEDAVENANWNTPVNASIPPYRHDKWYIGTYVSYSGDQSIYVTYNNGATNLTGTSNIDDGFEVYGHVWAYRARTVPVYGSGISS